MHFVSVFFGYVIFLQVDVFAELSSSSCSLLRTADSLTTIIPEIAQLAMRYYRASSFSIQHHREKRFLFNENTQKDVNSATGFKGTVIEQMIINSIQDVNFTNVAISVLNNNETMYKLRKNINSEVIIRIILREIDYEKLASGFWSAAESNFDLEDFIVKIINVTRIDIVHDEIFTNGTLPEWLLIMIHPKLKSQEIQRIFSTLKNLTEKFVRVLSKSERVDQYLFNMVIQQALTPLNNIIQGVQKSKPTTFNQLIEIIINNINKATIESIKTNGKRTLMKISNEKSRTLPIEIIDLDSADHVKMMLYQWSIAIDSMAQTVQIILKSLEKLYCSSSWE